MRTNVSGRNIQIAAPIKKNAAGNISVVFSPILESAAMPTINTTKLEIILPMLKQNPAAIERKRSGKSSV